MENRNSDANIKNNIDGDANANAIATATGPAASVDQLNDPAPAPASPPPSPPYLGGILEIMEEEDEEVLVSSSSANQNKINASIGKSGGQKLVPISEGGTETNTTSLFSIDIHNNYNNGGRLSDDVVYVAVGKSASSMDALQWTLDHHSVHPRNTLVYLIHIFSGLKFIPSPLGGGMVAKSQVSQDLVEHHLAQETRKRRELLTKYIDKCTSHMVQVETILVESDSVANAIVELISVLNIRQLVVGISKSNLRKVKIGKGSATVADQIRQRTPEGCELKIVCQGKQMSMSESDIYNGDHLRSPSFRPSLSQLPYDEQQQPASSNSFSCCFKL